MILRKLNLGCGTDIRPGYVNLHAAELPGVDVAHNIEKLPLPFRGGEFDEILALDVLEHVDYPRILKDLHRILAPGGRLIVRVPHFTSRNNYVDPTHKRRFALSTFDFFTEGSRVNKEKGRAYYFDFKFSHIASRRITFEKHMPLIRTIHRFLVEPLVNSSRGMQDLYEATGFSRWFPAQNIEVTLTK